MVSHEDTNWMKDAIALLICAGFLPLMDRRYAVQRGEMEKKIDVDGEGKIRYKPGLIVIICYM